MTDELTTETPDPAAPVETKKKKADPAPTYVATTGLSWSGGRCEDGDDYTGPAESVEWLLEAGLIAEKGAK